jgi:biotin carboxylase
LLFFVEAATTGAGLTMLRSLTVSGRRTAFITSKLRRYADSPDADVLRALRASGRLIEVPTTDEYRRPAVLDALLDDGEPAGVVVSGDHYLPCAAALAQDVGAPFLTHEAVALLRDKRRARELYDGLEIGRVRWADLPDRAALLRFADETKAPIVIKNVRGTGSQDVIIVRSRAEAVHAWETLSSRDRYLEGDLMVEEYVEGPLVSCETVIADYVPIHLGCTDRQLSAPPAVAEIGYTFPASVGPQFESKMFAAVDKLVAALGVRQGVFHSEFVLAPDGAHLIEVNARVPGALVTYMLRDCLDGDYYALVADAALGKRCDPLARNGLFSSGYIVYAPRAGRARTNSDTCAAARYPWVTDVLGGVTSGQVVGPPEDYRGAIGHVRTVAPAVGLAYSSARAAAQRLIPELAATDQSR